MPDESEPEITAAPAEAPAPQPADAATEDANSNAADPMAAIARLTAAIEKMQRAASSPASGGAQYGDIIQRIERLERWVASNRLT